MMLWLDSMFQRIYDSTFLAEYVFQLLGLDAFELQP